MSLLILFKLINCNCVNGCFFSSFYLKCLLPEIVDPVFKHRLMISDIRDPNKNVAVTSAYSVFDLF